MPPLLHCGKNIAIHLQKPRLQSLPRNIIFIISNRKVIQFFVFTEKYGFRALQHYFTHPVN